MKKKKLGMLDRILGRVDDLDSINLNILVQRLARERALMESVFHSIQEGILVVNQDGLIEYANDSACKMINLKHTDVGTAVIWKIVPDLAKSLEMTLSNPVGKNKVISREIALYYPIYRYVHLYIVAFQEFENNQSPDKYTFILNDVTSDKVSTDKRIESEKTASIFLLAAGVAHELGNPLNSLHIHLQLISRIAGRLDDSEDVQAIKKYLEVCSSEVDRLDGITKNFLQAIRPSSPDLKETWILPLLEETLAFQSQELSDLGVKSKIDLPARSPVVLADENQLKQVFFNIIKNASEAMRDGGKLIIRIREDQEKVYIQFSDNGIGISQEDMSQIFEPYFTTKSGGSGLGMMIVQRILREHGATIGIDSQLETGTQVTLSFPQKNKRVKLLH